MLSAAATAGLMGGGASGAAATGEEGGGPLPTIALGPHRVSRLIAGSNTIMGYSYMGPHTDRHMREYFTTERAVGFLEDCAAAGITAHQFGYSDQSVEYLRRLEERESPLRLIALHSQRDGLDEAIEATRPIAVAHHGGVTDRLFAEGHSQSVHDYVKAVRDRGLLAGVSAHNPDCIRRIADEGWDVDFFMASFYFLTRRVANRQTTLPTLEIDYPFFRDDPQVMAAVLREVEQPCLAFKILAGGRLCSNQEKVRTAFRFAFENIKPSDGVIVGMFPWYFDEVGANAQYTRELGAPAA